MDDPIAASPENIARAAQFLHADHLVAFPTETVYGLGANALSETAVSKIFSAKGRPSDNPLIVHVHGIEAARPLVQSFDPVSARLAHVFWPGPLTIVLPLRENSHIAKNVSADLDTVGIRVPNHPVALALLKETKLPLAAPSANKSGSPSPTSAKHVFDDLRDSRDIMIIDGGSCPVGLESTVVQFKAGVLHILRPGGVSAEQMANVLEIDPASIRLSYHDSDGVEAPRAPGMKYRHYAPRAAVVAVTDWSAETLEKSDVAIAFDDTHVAANRLSFGSARTDVETASSRLFDLFRKADEMHATRILVDCTFDRVAGMGPALWNRVSKASSRI